MTAERGETIQWRSLLVPIYGPTILISIGMGAVLPLIALSALDLGASVAQAAVVVGLIGVGQLAGDLPAGALAHRFGEKPVLLAACVVEAAAMLVASQTGSLAVLSTAMFVSGLSTAVFGLARHAYLTEAVAAHFRARALSTLGGTFRIGSFIGPFVGALLVDQFSIGATYAFAACMSLSGGLLSLTLPSLPGVAPISPVDNVERPPGLWSVLARHRRVLLTLGVGVLLISAARATRQSIVPLWAESQGLDASTVSVIFGISAGVDMLLFYPGGAIMDRFGRLWVALPAMVVIGAGFLVLPLTASAVAIGLVACLMGLGNGISSGIVLTLGADVAPEEGRRQFLGGWRLCADIGNVAGPGLISLITLAFPLAAAAVSLGAIAWFGAGWLAKWVPAYAPTRRRVKAG
ncbi:MFS transporter [Glycomyces arizonensis]|uniref:MFS transporter n=1 Tax=Glycomyces arizonensis TaxID=256035 RepID=UPI00040AC185|nr:MFS transporter [Glycomyces arizonensis]